MLQTCLCGVIYRWAHMLNELVFVSVNNTVSYILLHHVFFICYMTMFKMLQNFILFFTRHDKILHMMLLTCIKNYAQRFSVAMIQHPRFVHLRGSYGMEPADFPPKPVG
jgi:hypothetical protein